MTKKKKNLIKHSTVSVPKIDLKAQMKKEFTSFHDNLEDALKSDKPTRYVTCSSGIMEVRNNEIGLFIAKTNKIGGAEDIKEKFKFNLPKKIPYEMFLKTLAFFRGINDLYSGAEAALQIFWNREEQEYFFYIPKQEVSGSTVNFDRNEELEQEHLLVMDIHSHNTMGAFWSGTDNADEKETRLFGVLGKITSDTPEYKFRAVCGGNHIDDLNIWDIFENPFAELSYPEEWHDQVSERKSVVKPYNISNYYNYHRNYYKNNKVVNSKRKYKDFANIEDDKKDSYLRDEYPGLFDDDYTNLYNEIQNKNLNDISDIDKEFVESIVSGFNEDSVELLITKLMDEGYDGIIKQAFYSKA